jgi:hypothetical protein
MGVLRKTKFGVWNVIKKVSPQCVSENKRKICNSAKKDELSKKFLILFFPSISNTSNPQYNPCPI